MSQWPSTKGRRVYSTIKKLGWKPKQNKGSSHIQMVNEQHPEWGEVTWAFNDSDEIGPKMLARIAKRFKFSPEDL